MKNNLAPPFYETSADLEEQFFQIGDPSVIFDILRSKMYSNPILAICREISCNARDAHREVGTPDLPIHIYLPNNLEPYYKIKDFGPGIGPDRIENIFIKYGNSTKRNDNIQVGFFGMGGKSPFAYSDSFSIITIHDGIKYNYGCAIDETKIGKLVLLSKMPTKDANGTEIIIPVKPIDFKAFKDWTEHATRHFTVKPIINGGNIVYKETTKLLDGDNWLIASSSDYYRGVKLIIDGIEYPLELDTLRKYTDIKLINVCRGCLYLYFNTGELSLSASREQVYLDKSTQEKILQKLKDVELEIAKRVELNVASYDNLWDANVYFNKDLTSAFSSFSFLGKILWRGIPLKAQENGYIYFGCPVFSFSKGKYSRKYGTDPNKLTRSQGREVIFVEHSVLYINDLSIKEPTTKHIKKAFDNDEALKYAHIICPISPMDIDNFKKTYHLDEMGAKLLSSITKSTARTYTPPTSRLLVFAFQKDISDFRQISYANIEEDKNKKVLCFLGKDAYDRSKRSVYLKNNKRVGADVIKKLIYTFPDFSFYGVDKDTPIKRIKEDLSNCIDFEKFIADMMLSNNSNDMLQIKYASLHRYNLNYDKDYTKIKDKIVKSDSIFLQYLDLNIKIIKTVEQNSALLNIYEILNMVISETDVNKWVKDNPSMDLIKSKETFNEKYPLLDCVSTYNVSKMLPAIIQYVNLIDQA